MEKQFQPKSICAYLQFGILPEIHTKNIYNTKDLVFDRIRKTTAKNPHFVLKACKTDKTQKTKGSYVKLKYHYLPVTV